MTRLISQKDVTDEVLGLVTRYAQQNYGPRKGIDWDWIYDRLEDRHGYCLEWWDSPARRKISRHVLEVLGLADRA
jgi:hypothetical protein